MAISEIPEDFVDLARKDMPVDQPILLKVLSYDEYNIPQVEFFKRNVDGGLFCINKSISMGSELRYIFIVLFQSVINLILIFSLLEKMIPIITKRSIDCRLIIVSTFIEV